MRYFQEYRHKFSNAPGMVIDAGKKLLGYIANQKRLSGVDSLIERISVQDESGAVWKVEARFDKDIASVRIFPPDGNGGACEMYVESGLLDLGPNIASDASQRFNRGLPAFNDDPATLYFGDGVECVDGQPGLNGTIRLQGQSVASGCLPSTGNGIASRLTDPVKKQAQALLPASGWSGLMQRYVQAVYGGVSLDYEADGDALVVEGVSIGFGAGLIEVAGTHLFVFAGSGPITMAPLLFKSACGEAVYRAWQNASLAVDQSNKLLTIALSDAYPGDTVAIGDAGELNIASPYGWQFSAAEPEAHVVVTDATDATLKKLAVSVVDGAYVASVTDVETAPLAPAAFPCILIGPDGTSTSLCSTDGLTFGESFDHPVHCYYDGDDLVVVRYMVQTPALAVELQDGWECSDASYGTPTIGQISWGTDAIADALNCSVLVQRQFGQNAPPDTHTSYAFSMNKNTVTTGLFAVKGDTTLWSMVRESESLVGAFPAEDGSDEGDRSDPGWFFKEALTVQLRTMNLGDSFTINVVHSESAGNIEFTYCGDLYVTDDTYGSSPTKCSFQGPNFLTYISYDAGTDTECTSPVDLWSPLVDPTTHDFTIVSSSISCVVPCRYVRAHQFSGDLLLGPKNYLAIPAGDCAAAIPVNLKVSGAKLGDSPASDGYKIFTGRSCNDHYAGNCTGTITSSCNGYDPTVPGFTHSPHDEDTHEIVSADIAFYKSSQSNNSFPIIDPDWVDGTGPPVNFPFPLGDGSDAGSSWIKERIEIDWTSIVVAGGVATELDGLIGQLEALVSGSEEAWESTEDPVTCPTWQGIVYGAYTLDPITVDGDGAETSVERMYLHSPTTLLQNSFSYTFRRSLLNACVSWADPLDFGASIGMDRETITGGYSPVATPSFVGWA